MINLLPVEEKQKIKKIYHLRVVTVCFALASILGIVSLVAFTPGYFWARTRYDEIAFAKDALDVGKVAAEKEELVTTVSLANKKIVVLQGETVSLSPQELFREILSVKGEHVRLSGLSFEAVPPVSGAKAGAVIPQARLSVKGVSPGREDLIGFISALNAKKVFTSIDLPIGNFVKEKDLDFSIEIIIAQKSP